MLGFANMTCCWIILVSTLVFQRIDGLCQQDSDGNHFFGPTCEFLCHCKNNEFCDIVTGYCPSGCKYPWTGLGCQRYNLVMLAAVPSNKDIYIVNGSSAFDGDTDTCERVDGHCIVQLEKPQQIRFMRLYFKTPFPRSTLDQLQQSIHLLNTCKDVSTTTEYLRQIIVLECPIHDFAGVIFVPVPFDDLVELCEINVFGDCPEFQCGKDCLLVCHCKEYNYYEKLSGNCSNGCAGRWAGEGSRCDKECDDQSWGSNCTNRCGKCKESQPCDVKSGVCLNGCADGYIGPVCITECQDGLYGDECARQCGSNCFGGFGNCNHINGSCKNGCEAGWHGDRCIQASDVHGEWLLRGTLAAGTGALIIIAFVVIYRKTRTGVTRDEVATYEVFQMCDNTENAQRYVVIEYQVDTWTNDQLQSTTNSHHMHMYGSDEVAAYEALQRSENTDEAHRYALQHHLGGDTRANDQLLSTTNSDHSIEYASDEVAPYEALQRSENIDDAHRYELLHNQAAVPVIYENLENTSIV